jgi:hypothetical protein
MCQFDWSPTNCHKNIKKEKRNFNNIYPLKKIKILTEYVNMPNNYTTILENYYGKNWKIPKYTHS